MKDMHASRGVARIFSEVRTTHQMPLSPPPRSPVNVPKVKVTVSLSVYDVSKQFEKFFVAFLSSMLKARQSLS